MYSALWNWPFLNKSGQTAFGGTLTGSGVDLSNNHGIWVERSGSLALVTRAGEHAPGTAIGVNFGGDPSSSSYLSLELNNAGEIAFIGSLTGSGVDSTNDRGIWSGRSGGLALVARTGSHAPDTPSGTYFRHFQWPNFNNASQTAFLAGLAGSGVDATNDYGIWTESSGTLALIAREGTHAPGTPNGVNYSYIGLPRAGLNDAGQIAFSAGLTGAGVDGTNDGAIWATDRAGVLQLIVREGELLEVAPGDFRTIKGAFFSADNITGNSVGFNNLGQLAFQADFTDGSWGVFVSNAVANFAWKNLTNVHFFGADLTGADLTGADARGAPALNLSGVTTTNLIHPDGHIAGLNLAASEKLVAYPGVPIPVQVSGGFPIAPTATFDLTDNNAIVQSSAETKAADLARLYGHVKHGYHGGDWQGTGITSSTAAADPDHRTTLAVVDNALLGATEFSGQTVNNDSLLLKYTYYGDIDLNGRVDGDDLTTFALNFGQTTGMTQVDGDIDFNGRVDGEDLTVFANNFNKGIGSPLSAGSVQAVPEPQTIGLLLVGLAALYLAKRRRWHKNRA